MAVRQFSLINDKGQEFSLMDIQNYCFLSSPSGLGVAFDREYEQMGNTFVESINRVSQGKIPGTLCFKNYDNYLKLSNFILNSKKLLYNYIIPFESGKRTFYKDVKLLSLSKAELDNKYGVLVSQVNFDCLTLWYENIIIEELTDDSEDAMVWDFKWDPYFVEYSNREVDLVNKRAS